MLEINELMRLAKDSRCACKVCQILRKELLAQAYQEIQRLRQAMNDIEDAQNTLAGSDVDSNGENHKKDHAET